jgi:hypothetical protein
MMMIIPTTFYKKTITNPNNGLYTLYASSKNRGTAGLYMRDLFNYIIDDT